MNISTLEICFDQLPADEDNKQQQQQQQSKDSSPAPAETEAAGPCVKSYM